MYKLACMFACEVSLECDVDAFMHIFVHVCKPIHRITPIAVKYAHIGLWYIHVYFTYVTYQHNRLRVCTKPQDHGASRWTLLERAFWTSSKQKPCMHEFTYIHTYIPTSMQTIRAYRVTHRWRDAYSSFVHQQGDYFMCRFLHSLACFKKTSLLCLHAEKSHVWFIYMYYENYANGNRKVLSTLTLDGSFVPA
jgi:hypothetical protein